MGSSSAPSRAASAPGLSSNSSSLCLCSPTAATPPLRRCRLSFSVFFHDPSTLVFYLIVGFFSSMHRYSVFRFSRIPPSAQPSIHFHPVDFSFLFYDVFFCLFICFLCRRSVDAFRHHRHASAVGTVCEETENTGMPCESFFHFFFRRKKRTIRCCAAFLGLGKPSTPPTTSPRDNTHTKRKPASVFSSCRSSVQVLLFFFSLFFFFISSGLLFVVFIFIFYVRYLSWSSSSLLIPKHPGGFFVRKKVSESDSSHQPHCHIKPPVLQPLWGKL